MSRRNKSRKAVKNSTTMTSGWRGVYSESDTGLVVNAKSLMSYAPIYYGVSKVSGHIGISPIELKKTLPNGKSRPAPGELPADDLLNVLPNELMTAVTVKETTQADAMVMGNGRLGILRNARQQPVELIPLSVDRTHTILVYERSGDDTWLPKKWHVTVTGNGERVKIPDADVIHVMGIGADSLSGWSLVELAKNSIGGGLAAEKHCNRTYKNNAVPGLILEAPEGVFADDQEAQEFLENFNRFHSGVDRANRVGLLRFGVKASPLSMTGRDAQFLEQRQFTREEAALWTGVEVMLGVESNQTYNSIGQRNQAYFQNCLSRWVVKWEQEVTRKLISKRDRKQGYFFKVNLKEILRGSLKERLDSYSISRTIGLQSQEEIREEEGLGDMDPSHNFDNPATTPGTPSDSPPTEDAPDNPVEDRLRDVIRNQVERYLASERIKLLALSKKPEFLKNADEFYSGDYHRKLSDLVRSLGGTMAHAEEYISDSKGELANMMATIQTNGMTDSVDNLTKTWPCERGRDLADKIARVSA